MDVQPVDQLGLKRPKRAALLFQSAFLCRREISRIACAVGFGFHKTSQLQRMRSLCREHLLDEIVASRGDG